MTTRRFRIASAALGALIFALSMAQPAGAYIRLTRQGPGGPVVQAHWLEEKLPLRSVINPTNNDIPAATALAVVQASAETWENINTSFFTVDPVEFNAATDSTAALNANDGQNSVFFDQTGVNFAPGGTVIAFVRSIVDLNDGHTLDADMVFNDRDFFSSTSSPTLTPPPPTPPGGTPQSSVDLQSVITHEYGHYFSLDHTSIADATMIPFIIGDTRQRTLELDDMAGNSVVYPETAARGLSPGAIDFEATTGTISGTVVSGYDGSAVFGAHVEALLISDPSPAHAISNISGELTLRNGQGEWAIHGLPPGDYQVRIVPLDGIHTIAADPNIGGPFNGIDINFETEFWNGAGEGGNGFIDLAADFTPVTVNAAATTSGIAFISNTFPGQVDIAQYGQFENIVTFRNTGFLAKRFDMPFATPYTIKKITFPSFTFNAQVGLPPLNATFPSVRLCELNTVTGLPNLAAPLFSIAPFVGSPNGGNEVPINLVVNDPGKILFWCIEFPAAPPTFPLNFPFIRTDVLDMERGLFGMDYSINAAGTTATFVTNQNFGISMTCQLDAPESAPIAQVPNLGANRRTTKVEWSYTNPPNKRLDGFPLPGNSLDHVELIRRLSSGLMQVEATAGAGAEGMSVRTDTIPAFPSGTQFWWTRAVDKFGHTSLVSNTTITGLNEDADEPNGRGTADEAKTLVGTQRSRPETYSPAGDRDFFLVTAKPGDLIEASAIATGSDGRNDLDLVMFLLDSNGDVLTFDDESAGSHNPKISFKAPPPGGNSHSTIPRKFYIFVTNFRGSSLSPAGVPQTCVPQTYVLNDSVTTPPPPPGLAGRFGEVVGEDGFAFVNSGPNPANPQSKMIYVLPRGTSYDVKLRIYDVNGRLVRTLVNGTQEAGPHTAVWDGTDDGGRGIASGHYYARLEAGKFVQKVGITILK